MTDNPQDQNVDDLFDAVRDGRPLKPGAHFRVLIADETLDFKKHIFEVLRHFTWIWPDRIGGPPGSQSGRSWR